MTADLQPRWRIIYDLVRDLEPGDTISHDRLSEALGGVPDRHVIYHAMRRAIQELRENDQRSMGSIRGGGYRMLLATEHESQAMRYRDQSGRKMRDGLSVLRATRLGDLDEPARTRAVAATVVLEGLVQRIEGITERQAATEEVLASVIQRVEKLEGPAPAGEDEAGQ
jgi:hypothetical protein